MVGDLAAEMQAMRLEIHGVRETLPLVLIGHVITPSQALRIPQKVNRVFDSLGLSLTPQSAGKYQLPKNCESMEIFLGMAEWSEHGRQSS